MEIRAMLHVINLKDLFSCFKKFLFEFGFKGKAGMAFNS